MPLLNRLANSLGPDFWGAVACEVPMRVWADSERICARTESISIWLICWLLSGGRNVNAGFAQADKLVAQRALADSQPLGRLAPVSLARAQRIENQVALGLVQ